jgi:hypothetical protein
MHLVTPVRRWKGQGRRRRASRTKLASSGEGGRIQRAGMVGGGGRGLCQRVWVRMV